jgi:hypothetical protein
MRSLAVIAILLGMVAVIVGGSGLHTATVAWGPISEAASRLPIDPQQFHRHWFGSSVFVIFLGIVFLVLAAGLWARSGAAGIAWLVFITALTIFCLILYMFRPMPFGFQQGSLAEFLLLFVLSITSYIILRPRRTSIASHENNQA